ncbi:MAG: SAP domain-containing protein [Candidatus Sulfobium sp.]|jgi:hypothetical protein
MMKIADIRKIARDKGVNSWKLNKVELIRTIQRAEGYDDCFATPHVRSCGQINCLWREDCINSVSA